MKISRSAENHKAGTRGERQMKIPAIKPAALMSYTRFDDDYSHGYLSEFGAWVSKEVEAHTGIPFPIFRDTQDIAWGEQFDERVSHTLDASTFLIPILTPSFFASDFCRYELERFLQREAQLGRNDLVLPVHFVRVPGLENESSRTNDPLMQNLANRQLIDWRDLRFAPVSVPEVRRRLGQMAAAIALALDSVENE
jgi:F-box protein 11